MRYGGDWGIGLAEFFLLCALVVLGLRIGGVWAGDAPLIVAAALVLLGLVFNVYGAYLEGRAWRRTWQQIQPDYEAGKATRERKERLNSLAQQIVSRTLAGVWEGWEGRSENEWRQLTADMDKTAVERLVFDACWDDKTRAEYLAITKPETKLNPLEGA